MFNSFGHFLAGRSGCHYVSQADLEVHLIILSCFGVPSVGITGISHNVRLNFITFIRCYSKYSIEAGTLISESVICLKKEGQVFKNTHHRKEWLGLHPWIKPRPQWGWLGSCALLRKGKRSFRVSNAFSFGHAHLRRGAGRTGEWKGRFTTP